MKASRMIELLSKCSPDADVRIYFPNGDFGDFSDSVEVVENHKGRHEEQLVFLYSFSATEKDIQEIWTKEKVTIIAKESDFLETEGANWV